MTEENKPNPFDVFTSFICPICGHRDGVKVYDTFRCAYCDTGIETKEPFQCQNCGKIHEKTDFLEDLGCLKSCLESNRMTYSLKPCPFCGSRDLEVVEHNRIKCKNCRSESGRYYWIETAIEAWNKRE